MVTASSLLPGEVRFAMMLPELSRAAEADESGTSFPPEPLVNILILIAASGAAASVIWTVGAIALAQVTEMLAMSAPFTIPSPLLTLHDCGGLVGWRSIATL